mgnify:CR=1 FL=1
MRPLMGENGNQTETSKGEKDAQEFGLLETYGTFPVWMLKGIQLLTPSFLIVQSPPKDEDTSS